MSSRGVVKRLAWIPILAVLAALLRGGAALVATFDGNVRDEITANARGNRLSASVYEPTGRTGLPAVVLCHGISASRRHMDPLARELARRGFLVVTFDYGGHGDSEDRSNDEARNVEDVKAAIALARKAGGTGPLALVGHSMGVNSAVAVGIDDPSVACVVALGQKPGATADRPRALLAGAGLMDPFHSYAEIVKAVSEPLPKEIAAFETVTDAKTGAMRRVAFSGACEHAGEVYDGALLGETVAFIERALSPGVTVRAPEAVLRPPVSVSLVFLSNLALVAALLVAGSLLGSFPWTTTPVGRRIVSVALLAVAVSPLLLSRAGILPVSAARALTPALLVGALLATALLARPVRRSVVLLTTISFLAAWLGGTVLGAVPAYLRHPEMLSSLPLYLWQGLAFRAQFTLESLASQLVVSPLAEAPHGSLPLYLILALEVVLPGTALAALAWLLLRIYRALGGKVPDEPVPAAEPGAAPSRGKLGLVLAGLTVIAFVLFLKRSREGLMAEPGATETVLLVAMRLLVLPAAAMTAAVWALRLVGLVGFVGKR
jgi:pimeloyl-ACP methyl ester carboxylesterase